uniref:Uncharacterized protein n=1 Tax=Monopterus albus TaxID=43700 RepID=A0A3Q3Q463_MONAL
MVFFTCNACGESLKKAQVDKHVNICRGCNVLSCIDCGKDFWGGDYKNHIKCISEDQKYGGKGYEAKANKGDVKQQQWIQRIHEAMNNPGISAKLKNVLEQVSMYDNVPRKKAKFEVGVSSTFNNNVPPQQTKEDKQTVPEVKGNSDGNEMPNSQPNVEKKKLNKQERKEARQQKNRNGAEKTVFQEPKEDQAGKKKKKDTKRKLCCEEDDGEGQNGHSAENGTSSKKRKNMSGRKLIYVSDQLIGKFNWKGNIKAVLRGSPDQELSVKKLRKKVLAAYYSFTGDGNLKTDEEVLALFNKKINNNPAFRVLKDRVKLVK